MSARTVGDVLAAQLRGVGVRRTFGLPLGDLDHVPVDDWDLAVLLADADGRVGGPGGGGRLGAALLPGPVLHLSSAPGGRAPLRTVASPEELAEVLAGAPGVVVPGTTAVHLDLDPGAPWAADVPVATADRVPVLTLDPSLAGLRLLVVAGAGVVRAGGVAALASLARSAAAPVLVTPGALGAVPITSSHHAGVVGLQERDLALGGLDEADVVVATGLDPAELDPALLGRRAAGGVPVLEVPPSQLGELARRWERTGGPPVGRASLRAALAPVLDPLVGSAAVPPPAARIAVLLAGALPAGGAVVADPGAVGFWVARCHPAREPGECCVPATAEPGWAAAAALVLGLDGRAALAVTDAAGAASPATAAVLDLARSLGLPLWLQVWDPDGEHLDTDGWAGLLGAGPPGGVSVRQLAVDAAVPPGLVDVAGPAVAWGGPAAWGAWPGGGGA